jgi:hypothetical protein
LGDAAAVRIAMRAFTTGLRADCLVRAIQEFG